MQWLYARDKLAPCVLFTFRVWGSTNLAHRAVRDLLAAFIGRGPSVEGRLEAVQVLGKIGGEGAWAVLSEVAEDEKQGPAVRELARTMLPAVP